MCDELITRIEYNEMRADYKAQAERIQAAINTLSEERRLSLQEPKENSPQLAAFIKYENFECLSREILTELVDCIYIKEDGGISIQFKFADHFKHILS